VKALRVENWVGHPIRFVEKDGEWQAVLADIAAPLGLDARHINERLTPEFVSMGRVSCEGYSIPATSKDQAGLALPISGVCEAGSNDITSEKRTRARKTQEMLLVNEFGLYEAILESRKPEAKAFKLWVFGIIKTIRRDVLKLKEYEAFRLTDRELQKEAMRKLSESLREPAKVDYIKANIIADKAVSTMHGFPKLVKKPDMDESMLRDREPVLADTVELMALNGRFGLGLSVSEHIYRKYAGVKEAGNA
jgi:prophage antirepressor-like protein